MDGKLTKSLWIRIKGRAGTGVVPVRVCHGKIKNISTSSDKGDKPHIHRLWWYSTTLIPVHGTIQQGTGNPKSSL